MNRRRLGEEKEQFVCEYLKTMGYQILEQNFRCRFGEVDIVARQDAYLVFIEVKYRRGSGSGMPQEAVDFRKQKTISRVALFYLGRYGYGVDTPVRFDVAAVSESMSVPVVHVIQNAFEYIGKR